MSACIWTTSDQPRVILGRHVETCESDLCRGCRPCREPHCRVCYRTHADGTCAECLAETREALHKIAERCGALPAEVRHRGINGEAMMLLGPIADVEARQHVEASYLSGRLPEGWIEGAHGKGCPLLVNEACTGCAGGERHPQAVLLTWQLVWRDALEHDEAEDNALATAVDYLDRTMSYMAGFEHVPFEDFAGDLRACLSHIEGVLHDQDRGERANVPCFDCGADLERKLDKDGFDDHWTCRGRGCRRTYTIAEYNFALRASLEDAAREAG